MSGQFFGYREGRFDLFKLSGNTFSATNFLPIRLTDGTAYNGANNPLYASIVNFPATQAVTQSGTWSMGLTYGGALGEDQETPSAHTILGRLSSINTAIDNQYRVQSGYYPDPFNLDTGTTAKPLVDDSGSVIVRGAITTDEGGITESFSGNSLGTALSGTVTFTNGNALVTGTGTSFLSEVSYTQYVKRDADGDGFWAKVLSIDSDTQITLEAPYAGTSGTGGSASNWYSTTSGTGTISVGSDNVSLTCDTANGDTALIAAAADYGPLQLVFKAGLSQRIANQTVFAGFQDDPSTPQAQAGFVFTGTDSSRVICRTSTKSGSVIDQLVALPSGVTSTEHEYEIRFDQSLAAFWIDSHLVAISRTEIPPPYAIMEVVYKIINTGTTGSATNFTVAYSSWDNLNRFVATVQQPDPTKLLANVFRPADQPRTLKAISGTSTSSSVSAQIIPISIENGTAANSQSASVGKVWRIPSLLLELDATSAGNNVAVTLERRIGGASNPWVPISRVMLVINNQIRSTDFRQIIFPDALQVPAGQTIEFRRTNSANQSVRVDIYCPDAFEV